VYPDRREAGQLASREMVTADCWWLMTSAISSGESMVPRADIARPTFKGRARAAAVQETMADRAACSRLLQTDRSVLRRCGTVRNVPVAVAAGSRRLEAAPERRVTAGC